MELTFGRSYGMDRTMSFMPQLKAFLRENGIIYTVRRYNMIDARVEVEGIGRCHRIPLGKVTNKEELAQYVEFSGFQSLDSWWAKIKDFIPQPSAAKYLYRVSVDILQEGKGGSNEDIPS